MKKFTAIFLAFLMVATSLCFQNGMGASATVNETYIGDLHVTKVNGTFVDPTVNVMILLTPGQAMGALYYARLYAEWDSAKGAYVVVEKIATHCASSRVVGTNGIGLAFNYAPLSSTGSAFAKANWLIWDRIKVGDKLTLSGIDVANKTVDTSGTWGTTSFVSNALVKVTTVRDDSLPKTPFTGKTIVAMGDSVTVGGGWTEMISDTFNTTVYNSGFGGDTSTNYYNNRYQQYVADYNPDIVFVEFGINDALTYQGTAAGIETYKNTLRNIYKKNTAIGAKTIFMSPNNVYISKLDSTAYSAYGGLQGYLDAFIGGMRDVAAELGCHFIDVYTMWRNEGLAPANLIDTTHPTSAGYERNKELIRNYLTENMYDICDVAEHPTELSVKAGSGAAIDGEYLSGVAASTAVDGAKALFNEDAGYITVKNEKGVAVSSGIVGTGYTVNLVVDGAVIKSYTAIISGDATSDGIVNAADYISVKGALGASAVLSAACIKAVDFDLSGAVSSADYIIVKNMVSEG